MLRGILPVIQKNDTQLSAQLRRMDDQVDALYSAIKFYLTQMSREALSAKESRRWTDIMSFTINMEQVGDIIERVGGGRSATHERATGILALLARLRRIDADEAPGPELARAIAALVNDPAALAGMAKAARGLARLDTADQVAATVDGLLRR